MHKSEFVFVCAYVRALVYVYAFCFSFVLRRLFTCYPNVTHLTRNVYIHNSGGPFHTPITDMYKTPVIYGNNKCKATF